MPIIKAAIKHLRKSEKLRKVNRVLKNRMKDAMKEMLKLAGAKKYDEFGKKLPKTMSLIDKAAKGHLLHHNTAARKKSRLAHLLAAAK